MRDLRRENRRLRRENEYLRHLAMQYDFPPKEKVAPEQRMLALTAKRAHTLHAKTYYSYLFQRFQHSRPFMWFDKTKFALKNVQLAKKIWGFCIGLVAVLGISAQFLLVFSVLTVFIPSVLIVSAAIGIYSYWSHRRRRKRFRALLSGKCEGKIYLVFLPKEKSDGYFVRTLSQFSGQGHVFLITSSFRECGYRSLMPISDRVYKLHISAYFAFARRLPSDKTVKVYL